MENLRFLQNCDDYNCIIWYQIKEPIIILHLKGHAVKLKCVNYEIFWKNMIFENKKQNKKKKRLFKAGKYT